MSSQAWQEHFKEQLAPIEEQYKLNPQGMSLLCFAIEANAISSKEYLTWAIEAYQLPCLNQSFFKEQSPDSKFYELYKDQYNWSRTCFPISEWDGALLVACLEKPENYQAQTPTIFLLASYEDLASWWTRYQPSVIKTPAPQAASNNSNNPFELIKSEVAKDKTKKKVDPIESDMPAGLTLEPPKPIDSDSEVFTQIKFAGADKKSSAAGALGSNTSITSVTKTSTSFTKTKTGTHTSELSSKYILDMIRDTDPSFVPYVNATFDKMKIHFARSFILAVDNTEINARTILWDDSVTAPEETSILKLTSPSIFGLVAYTLKPYHGYISPSETNERFFEEWNEGSTPDHATVVPIMFMGRLVGLLVGIGEKSAYTKAVLKFMRKIGKDISAQTTGGQGSQSSAA